MSQFFSISNSNSIALLLFWCNSVWSGGGTGMAILYTTALYCGNKDDCIPVIETRHKHVMTIFPYK
jgi:hypothetical protein